MKSLTVRVHRINGLSGPALDERSLTDLFRSADIQLSLIPGSSLDYDPAGGYRFSYKNYIPRFRAEDGVNAHLILAGLHPDANFGIAGELVDLDTRGLAVVYQSSYYIAGGGQASLLQTVAHEIGHICNLAHEDVSFDFDSVMNQASERDQTVASAWRKARVEANREIGLGHPAYWQAIEPTPACYPFCLAARSELNTSTEQRFNPWRGPYDRPYGGANDAWYSNSALRVVPDAASFMVGGVLALTIEFQNRTRRRITVPANLGSTFDNLIIRVTPPDGFTYDHRPRGLACSTESIVLAPGERVAWPFCTVRGRRGIALQREGEYEVKAIAPSLGVASMTVRFPVEEWRPPQARTDAAASALARVPSPQLLTPKARRAVASRYQDANLDKLTRGYLALAQLPFAKTLSERSRLERAALAKSSPREVRYAAAIAQAKRLIGEKRLPASARREFAERHFEDVRDSLIVRRIQELV